MNDTVTVIHAMTNTIGRKRSTFQSGREFLKHLSTCLNLGVTLLMHLASDNNNQELTKERNTPRDRQ